MGEEEEVGERDGCYVSVCLRFPSLDVLVVCWKLIVVE